MYNRRLSILESIKGYNNKILTDVDVDELSVYIESVIFDKDECLPGLDWSTFCEMVDYDTSFAKKTLNGILVETGHLISKKSIFESVDNIKFKNWFANSKMVNVDGTPGIYYHGVGKSGLFNEFDSNRIGSTSGNLGHFGKGFYFTDTKDVAESFSQMFGGTGDVISVYLKITNPFIVNRDNLISLGEKYDLNLPEKKDVGIDKDSVLIPLKKYDPIAGELLQLILDNGYSEGWTLFLDKVGDSINDAKLDLNDVADWSESIDSNEYDGVGYYHVSEMKEIGITPIIIQKYPSNIRMDYMTDLGANSDEWSNAIKSEGYDGIIQGAGDEIVVFSPSQIKSIANNGDYTNSPNMLESID